ncbi:MAG TPA: pyridoxal-phosphate dependent enzyme [Pseudonocardiaceae bacterium]
MRDKGNAWFKLENTQLTGSFKIRGAYNRIAADPDAQANGVVTSSSDNHGRAVAVVAQWPGVRASRAWAKFKAVLENTLGATITEHSTQLPLIELDLAAGRSDPTVP